MALIGKSVRRDCIKAFDRFFKDVDENLEHVSVHIDGRYYEGRNKFLDSRGKEKRSKGDRGTRACIVFGGGDVPVTTYAFHMRDLSDPKNAHARSLRYTPEGGAPVMVVRSEPGGDMGGAVHNSLIEEKMYQATCRAANSMSFGPMFYGWMDGAVRAGSGEEAALSERMSHVDAKGMTDWNAVRREPEDGDPLKAMAAWGMVGRTVDGMVAKGRKEMRDHPLILGTAYQSMGLGGLYRALEEMDGQIRKDPGHVPDLSEAMDPGTPEGREALRGLLCLSAYKEARDHAGMHGLDEDGMEFIEATDGGRGVYDRLTNTRQDAEARAAALGGLEAERDGTARTRCVQKLFAGTGGTGKASDVRVDAHLKYRFFRKAMLHEDPDMASGMPDLALRLRDGADPEALTDADILVTGPGLYEGMTGAEKEKFGSAMDGMPLKAFLDAGVASPGSACGKLLGKMPAMDAVASPVGGTDAVMSYASSRMAKAGGGGPVDILCLEMELFSIRRKGAPGPVLASAPGFEGASADSIARKYVANCQAYEAEAPRLTKAVRQAVGVPDFATGHSSFGECLLRDIEDGSYRSAPYGRHTADNSGRGAAAFRQADMDRRDACLVAEARTGAFPKSMAEAEQAFLSDGCTGLYHAALEKYGKEQEADLEKGSMMLNDFLVLSDCYGIYDRDGVKRLMADVALAYGGGGHEGLYRPVDNAECDALRQVYANGGAGWQGAVVKDAHQRTVDGFLSAVWNGAGDDAALVSKAAQKVRDAAADHDTFWDTKYGDMAARMEGPRLYGRALEMSKEAQARGPAEEAAARQLGGMG